MPLDTGPLALPDAAHFLATGGRLLAAAVLGGVIGAQRERREDPAQLADGARRGTPWVTDHDDLVGPAERRERTLDREVLDGVEDHHVHAPLRREHLRHQRR